MLLEYVDAALERAKYELIDDAEPYYGEIPECRGVWAKGRTLEECRARLRETLEGWLLVRIRRGLPVPSIHGKRLTYPQPLPARS